VPGYGVSRRIWWDDGGEHALETFLVFTRKHFLATRMACLGPLGVVLLVASFGASLFDSAPVPFDSVSGLLPQAAAQQPATATAGTADPTVQQRDTAAAPVVVTPEPEPEPLLSTFHTPTAALLALSEQMRMRAPLDPGDLDSAVVVKPATGLLQAPVPTRKPEAEQVDDGIRVYIPYRQQFDGSRFEGGNCGPASLAMILEYYGHGIETHALRESINHMSGDWGRDSGTSWTHLRRAAESFGMSTHGLTNDGGQMRQWTMDDLLAETREGRPVIVLVHYRSLPGHETAGWYGDHYVVFLGMTAAGDVVYHDPAFRNGEGEYVVTSQAQFEHAWTNTWIRQNRQAMSVGTP
jgi:predicted double-glycine peptidase